MSEEKQVVEAIKELLVEQGGIELGLSVLLDDWTEDPDLRSKSLTYLLGLEMIKLKARIVDTNDPKELHGTLAASLHSVLDMVFRGDVDKMLSMLDALKDGIVLESKLKEIRDRFPKRPDPREKWR